MPAFEALALMCTYLQRLAFGGAIVFTLLLWNSGARSREATIDMGLGQYAHRSWTIGEGVIEAPIHAIAQTPDGYLWLGTQIGLWRFDGIRATSWRAPVGRHLPGKWIQSLLATHDGTLWIGTDAGLATWHAGKLTEYPALAGLDVLTLLVDRRGTVWAGTESRATSTGRLCAIRNKTVHCYGSDGSLGARIYCLYEDSDGHLWFASSSGVWLWQKTGKPKLFPASDAITGYFQSLTSGTGGGVLFSGNDGLREIVNGIVRVFPLPGALPHGPPPWVLTDRDGALWVGTMGNGLKYAHAGQMESFGKAEGLSGSQVMRMFEDREGNVWVVTKTGFDEFWKIAAARFTDDPKFLDGNVTSVLSDIDGSFWFTMRTGLYRWKGGVTTVYRGRPGKSEMLIRQTMSPSAREIIARGLPIDTSGPLYRDRHGRIWIGSPSGLGYLQGGRFVAAPNMPGGELTSITEDDLGNLWVAHRMLGLFRISPSGQVRRFGWRDIGIGETWSIAFDPSRRGIWLGSLLGKIAFFKDGKIRASYAAGGLGKAAVRDLRLDPDGTLWAATEAGLVRLKNGRLKTLNSDNGLPCDIVHATIENAGSFWIYMACGLVRVARSDLDAWSSVSSVRPAIRTLVLGASDGVTSSSVWHFNPKIAKSPDGRLVLASSTGPMTVDPQNLYRNELAPPVHIEQIVADHKVYATSSPIRLPPLVRDLEIDYTALSFTAPEGNQFRYRLEGLDSDWHDADNRRQAFYTDVGPGNYRFDVIASNNSGVWNREGATLTFTIVPAYWQTVWFRVLGTVLFAMLLLTAYRFRMRTVARAAAHELEIEQRHRELELELSHANRLATLGQLTASITHEVRQPITSVLSGGFAARRWLDQDNVEKARQAIERMIKDATRAGDVVSGLRALVKKSPARTESFDMNSAILEVLVITRGEAEKNGISVRTQLEQGLPAIHGDRVQLQQVILNLVVNAVEAMRERDKPPRELVIKSEICDSEGILVSVQDTGPGFEPASLDRAFEAFYTTKAHGLGMGLSICRSIIEAHEGKLEVAANVPHGAIFRFTLPVGTTNIRLS